MFIHQRFIPGLAIASYLVGDEKSHRAAVIDPVRDIDEYIDIAHREGLNITDILETHVHADFVSGALELKTRLNGKPAIHCSAMGGPEWTPPYADHRVQDGDELRLGTLRLKAMHTPGHTPEHVTWLLYDDTRSKSEPWLAFTGDLLFVGDVGRPDLLGEKAQQKLAHQLYDTLFHRLAGLPDYTEIMPGHGAGSLCGKAIGSRRASTVGYERRFNASMQPLPEAKWINHLLDGMPAAPPYFARMKKVNAAGPAIIGTQLPGLNRITAANLRAKLDDNAIVLDVRSEEAFAAGHIPGSIHIGMGDSLPNWAGWVVPYDQPIYLVAASAADVPMVVRQLLRIGHDDVRGYLEGGISAWQDGGYELDTLQVLTVQQLQGKMQRGDGHAPMIVDVRSQSEWHRSHVEQAMHVELGNIPQEADQLPADRLLAVMCGSGYRASLGASLLKRQGFANVAQIQGGISAWREAQLPLTGSESQSAGCGNSCQLR